MKRLLENSTFILAVKGDIIRNSGNRGPNAEKSVCNYRKRGLSQFHVFSLCFRDLKNRNSAFLETAGFNVRRQEI